MNIFVKIDCNAMKCDNNGWCVLGQFDPESGLTDNYCNKDNCVSETIWVLVEVEDLSQGNLYKIVT